MPTGLTAIASFEERAWERFRVAAMRAQAEPTATNLTEKEKRREEFVVAFLAHYAGEPHDGN